MTQISYVARSYTDKSVTFVVGEVRYEYFMPTHELCQRVEYIGQRWPGMGLNIAKRKAQRWEKVR